MHRGRSRPRVSGHEVACALPGGPHPPLAACGGGDSADEAETTTTAAPAETTADTSGDDGAGLAASLFLGDRCLETAAAYGAALAAASAVLAPAGDAADINDALDTLEEMGSAAPDEIQADMELVIEAYTTFVTAVAELDIDFSNPASFTGENAQKLSAAAEDLDTAEYTAASERVNTWFQENCDAAA